MGFIIDTKHKELGIEFRRESVVIFDADTDGGQHIFGEGASFEISKEQLIRLLDEFSVKETRERLWT